MPWNYLVKKNSYELVREEFTSIPPEKQIKDLENT